MSLERWAWHLQSFFIYHLTWCLRYCWSQQYAGRVSYMNLVCGLAHHYSLVVQWFEHLTGVRQIIGSIPVGDSDFFSLSHSHDMMNMTCFWTGLPALWSSWFVTRYGVNNQKILFLNSFHDVWHCSGKSHVQVHVISGSKSRALPVLHEKRDGSSHVFTSSRNNCQGLRRSSGNLVTGFFFFCCLIFQRFSLVSE